MTTDQPLYSADCLIFMARTHQKVIDYYNYVLEELKPLGQERSRIVGHILREQALAEIEQLGGFTTAQAPSELPDDLASRLQSAIEDP